MKKILFLLFVPVFVYASPVPDGWEVPNAPVTVETIANDEQDAARFLLAQLIKNPSKRQIGVYFRRTFVDGKDDELAAAAQMEKDMIFYIATAYNQWRASANKYLPNGFKMPEIKFVQLSALSSAARTQFSKTGLPLSVRLYIGDGLYSVGKNEYALASASPTWGTGATNPNLTFAWLNDWFVYVLASVNPNRANATEMKRLEDLYRSSAAEKAAKKREQQAGVEKQLAEIPIEQIHRKGPFYAWVQGVITHEVGHLLGLNHITGEKSVMSPSADDELETRKPTDRDGRRLAELVCYFQNKRPVRAGQKRNVCRVVALDTVEDVTAELKFQLKENGF